MMKKLILILMFLLMVVGVSATASWTTWGNYGYSSGANGEKILFGSNWVNGSLSARVNVSDALTITYPPIIQDMDLDGKNEIWVISGSSIILYDEVGDLIQSISTGETLGRGVIANYQNDLDQEFILCQGNDLSIYDYNGENTELVKTWVDGCEGKTKKDIAVFDLGNTHDGTQANEIMFLGNIGANEVVNLSSIDYNTGVKYDYDDVVETGSNRFCSGDDNWENGILVGDIDRDGKAEAIIGYSELGAGKHYIIRSFEMRDDTLDWTTDVHIVGGGAFYTDECYIGYANIGTATSGYEIFSISKAIDGNTHLEILDSTGTIVYTDGHTTEDKSFFAVADIDFDGENEACYSNNTAFKCVDKFFNNYMNLTKSTVEDSDFISIGEYDQVIGAGNYQEFMTQSGIYSSDGSTITKEFDIGEIEEVSMVYPVSLAQQSSLNKDIAYFSKTKFNLFYTGIDPAICGNSVCESGENSLNCFQDCGTVTVQEIVKLTQIQICPNIDYMWKNGTRVTVSAKVETTDGSDAQARFKLYAGSDNEYDSGYSNIANSGTIFSWDIHANYTGFGTLYIEGKSSLSSIYKDIFQQQFNVDADEGWSYSDGCYNLDDPLSTTSTQASQTSNLDVGDYCDSDDQCKTDNCLNGKCRKKMASASCSSGSECISERCINGRCTAPSLIQSAENLKTETGGTDQASTDIISIILIILLAGGIGVLVGRSGNLQLGVLASLGVGVVGIIMFTLIGWLNPIFLLGIFIIGIIGVVIKGMMGTSTS